MKNWSKPHISKVYEALGAIGDNRIELIKGKNEARMYSSSRNKFYIVTWNDKLDLMNSNDNSAYYTDTLSYPMIAVLMILGKIPYHKDLPSLFKNIKWKDLNQKFKNDYDKTVAFVLEDLKNKRLPNTKLDLDNALIEIDKIYKAFLDLNIGHFGQKVVPLNAY